ncbi:MAG: FAD-dependent oxidoreductase, partial [Firmicutes bacterium]|nr:FAD-dependent oxidoreductase [Bacillota bacterium]
GLRLDSQGYIIANEKMETNFEGVYAAGDARAKYLRQVVTAAADGAIAAYAAEKYIIEEEGFQDSVLKEAGPVAVLFWSPLAPKSLELMPVIDPVFASCQGWAKLVKTDTYRSRRLAQRYGITENPSLVFFKQGRPVAKLVKDAISEDAIRQTLSKLHCN